MLSPQGQPECATREQGSDVGNKEGPSPAVITDQGNKHGRQQCGAEQDQQHAKNAKDSQGLHGRNGSLYESDSDLKELLNLTDAALVYDEQNDMILRFDHRFAMCDYHFFSSENRTKTGAIWQSKTQFQGQLGSV